ncbi:MAG: ORC-CDC6 family AAA ATPase [Dehalococcoidia bacterium]
MDRAADARMGNMVEERNFVGLFGSSALELISEKMQHIWERPILMISAPGGGKSSLMRIFSPSALRYVQEISHIGRERQYLADKLSALGAIKNGRPYALGIWLRLSEEYRNLDDFESGTQHGAFYALLNARIILSAINGICILENLAVSRDLNKVSLVLKTSVNSVTESSWREWGTDHADQLYEKMAKLESGLCDMIDNPFWEGDPTSLSHSGLWSLDLLAKLTYVVNGNEVEYRPLVMLDDINNLSNAQIRNLSGLLASRQAPVPLWLSARKQALGLAELINRDFDRGVEEGRDYAVIDFENSRSDFRKRVLEISKLRVQSVAVQIGGSSQAFDDFISDEREEIFLKNLDVTVAEEIKKRILSTAGTELIKFQNLIRGIETKYSEPHDQCRHLRMLEILVQREISKSQKSFPFLEIQDDVFRKHENNKAIVEAAELFLAKEYNLPYYFGAQRLVTLSSFNINQFLRLAGALFEEIMTAIRLERDSESFISPQRQHKILRLAAKAFLDDIPTMATNGNVVMRLVQAVGDMCRHETYRPTASYPPGVTGTAITMYEFDMLSKGAIEGKSTYLELYQAMESAIAYNILEPEPNYKCKGQEFLVLNLNRLLCIPFQLPLQRGGFREQKLTTLLSWINKGYNAPKRDREQVELWS